MGWGGGRSQICSLEIIPFLMGKRGKRHGNYLQTLQEMETLLQFTRHSWPVVEVPGDLVLA